MIKFTGTGKDGTTKMLFLGLTDKNLELLRAGRPMKIIGKEVGIDSDIMIFYGRDEQAILDMLVGVDLSRVPIHAHNDDDRQEDGEH